MRSPRRLRPSSDEDSQPSEEEEEPTPRNLKKQLQASNYSPNSPKPRKKSEKFETELAGHSEQILGQMPDFEKYHEKAFMPKKYPDQSFVNFGESNIEKPELTWPSQDKKEQGLQEKFDALQAKYDKDKEFYDKALEARTNQLEEKEDAYD